MFYHHSQLFFAYIFDRIFNQFGTRLFLFVFLRNFIFDFVKIQFVRVICICQPMYRLYVLKVILVQFLGPESLCFSVQYLSRGLWAQSRTRTINKWYDIPLKYLELITLITEISWHVRLIIVSPWCGSVVLYCGSGFSFIPPCGSGINLFSQSGSSSSIFFMWFRILRLKTFVDQT